MKRVDTNLKPARFLSGDSAACPESPVRFQLTGEAPGTASERLIAKITGDSRAVSADWLAERISETLYRQELKNSGGALDIGVWGPALFREEARRLLSQVRPEFGHLVRGDKTAMAGLRVCARPV